MLAVLILGLAGGYALGGNREPGQEYGGMTGPGHAMSEGRMASGGKATGSSHGEDMGMSEMMASMSAGLEGKSGVEFDRAFLSEMIVHHQGAVKMAELALKNSGRSEIRDLAEDIVSAQKREIADMEAWQAGWFNE